MKCCNLAAFDPVLQARGIRGLRKASRLDAAVWKEFTQDREQISFEAELAYANKMGREPRESADVPWEDVCGLDRVALVKVRVNQHFFRAMVIADYQHRCAVCQLSITSLLTASHIIPWSIDTTLRMNPRNGICLCTLHDRAFDRGILAITENYEISINQSLTNLPVSRILQDNFLRFDGQSIVLPERWHPDPVLLAKHDQVVDKAKFL
jgi:putative restriction endonuclease